MASDLPSWLQAPPPSEPFQALLAGVRAGTGIASNVLQGQRQAEQARQFNVEAEFKQRAEEYQLQLASLAVEKAKTARDYQFQTDRAATQIGQLLLTTRPDTPEYMNQLGAIGAQFPAVMSDPVWKHAIELPEQSARIKLQTAQAEHPLQTAEQRNIEAQVQRADRIQFSKTGKHMSPTEADEVAFRMGAPKSFHMSFGPNGELVADYGPEGATTATQSLAQKRMLDTREQLSNIEDTLAGMTGDAVGVKGKINAFMNKWAGQVNPDWVNLPVAEQQVKMANFNERQIRQYNQEGRLSELDRERIREIGPSTGWGETPERATKALTTLRALYKKNAIIDAKAAKTPVEDWMLTGLTPNDLKDLFQRNVMTQQEVTDAFRKLYPNQ